MMSKENTPTHKRIQIRNKSERLKARFGDKTYSEEWAWAYWIAYSFSFIVQGFSIVAAAYGAKVVLSYVVPSEVAAFIIGVIVLGILAWAQRQSSDKFWDKLWQKGTAQIGLMVLSLALATLGMVTSGFGTYEGTIRLAPTAAIIKHDTTLSYLQSQLSNVQSGIDASKKTTWKGKITRKSQNAIDTYSKTQNMLMAAWRDRMSYINEVNQSKKQEHELTVKQIAKITFCLFIILIIIFEGCICFCSYYDWRQYTEMQDLMEPQPDEVGTHQPIYQMPPDPVNPYQKIAAENQKPVGFELPKPSKKKTSQKAFKKNMEVDTTATKNVELQPVVGRKTTETTKTVEPVDPLPTRTTADTTATTKSVELTLTTGLPYVNYNGKKRDEAWIKKQRSAYIAKLKKGEGTEENNRVKIKLFDRLLEEINEMKKDVIE